MFIDHPVLVTEYIEDYTVHGIVMFGKPLSDGLHGDLCSPFRREAKYAGGDTAECNGPQAVFRAQI